MSEHEKKASNITRLLQLVGGEMRELVAAQPTTHRPLGEVDPPRCASRVLQSVRLDLPFSCALEETAIVWVRSAKWARKFLRQPVVGSGWP